MKNKCILVSIIMAVLIGIMACGASEDTKYESDSAIKEEKETSNESETEEETDTIVVSDTLDAISVGSKNYDKYLHLGESYACKYGNGDIEIEVIDVDYSVNGDVIAEGYSYASVSVYIAIEITNNTDEDIYFDQNDATLFIDDYEIAKEAEVAIFQQNGYCIVNNTKQYPTVINIKAGGRKGMIVFVTKMSDKNGITENSEIDFDICGLIFKINPNFILNQLAELAEANRIKASDDPFAGTEYEGIYEAIEQQNGTYTSSDGSIIITINGTKFSAQRSGENVIDGALFVPKDSSIPNYYVSSGSGLTVIFFDGGLIVEGLTVDGVSLDDRGLDGWYTSNGTANTESEVTTSSSDGIDTGIVYGTYSCSPNTVGGENIAYVYFTTDEDGSDFIMIDSYAADDEGMPNNFGGDVVENGNSYSVTGASGKTLSITFVEGGMKVEVLSGDDIEEFAGYYQLDEALDLNSVS